MGSRCEYKDLDGSYLRKCWFCFVVCFHFSPSQKLFFFFVFIFNFNILIFPFLLDFFSSQYKKKIATRRLAMLQTASIASGAFLALFLVLVLCLVFYVRWHQQQKRDRCNGVHEENGFDAVDGLHTVRTAVPELRPFGPHHQRFIPMSHAYSNNNNHR